MTYFQEVAVNHSRTVFVRYVDGIAKGEYRNLGSVHRFGTPGTKIHFIEGYSLTIDKEG